MNNNNLQEKLKRGENIYGTSIVSTSPIWSDALQGTMLDFVFIDTEHISLARNEIANLCHTYKSIGIAPVVRISNTDAFTACVVKDAGAVGVVVPYVERVEQVRDLVGATKYRPLKGVHLRNLLMGKVELTDNLKTYLSNYNKGSLSIINIESKAGLSNLNALLNVSGLDGVIIGPHDLSVSMGMPEEYENPEFERAVKEIIHRTRDKGLAVGIHLPENPDLQIKWIKEGVNIVLHSSDLLLFGQKLKEDIAKIRMSVGDASIST
jgi:2-keto-3-deoxy-L-rhamnonate aldolase RhmA